MIFGVGPFFSFFPFSTYYYSISLSVPYEFFWNDYSIKCLFFSLSFKWGESGFEKIDCCCFFPSFFLFLFPFFRSFYLIVVCDVKFKERGI